jgi:hypothetical protein
MEKAVAEGKTPPLIAARQLLELAAAHPRVVSA